MSKYTEINFGAVLGGDTPTNVICALSDLSKGWRVRDVIDHPFFDTPRHREIMVGASDSFLRGFYPLPMIQFDVGQSNSLTVVFRSSLKNYDREIELFLDWIRPYIIDACGASNYFAVVCNDDGLPKIYYCEEHK